MWDNQIAWKLMTLAQSAAKQAPSFALRLDQVKTLPADRQSRACSSMSRSTIKSTPSKCAARPRLPPARAARSKDRRRPAGHVGAHARRPPAESLLLHQGEPVARRPRRHDSAAERTPADRLGMRAQHRHRQDRQARKGGATPRNTSSATRSTTTSPIAAVAPTDGTAPTGSSARATTRSSQPGRLSCRGSSCRIRSTCRSCFR